MALYTRMVRAAVDQLQSVGMELGRGSVLRVAGDLRVEHVRAAGDRLQQRQVQTLPATDVTVR
jgi:hypothetical protein